MAGRTPVLFLDYDGTLAPIVENPDEAFITDDMRETVRRVAACYTTAIVTGRAKEKVKTFVGLSGLVYAGSHGFDIDGPAGLQLVCGKGLLPALQGVTPELRRRVAEIPGATVEDNVYSVTVHYRRCAPEYLVAVDAAVRAVAAAAPQIEVHGGKKVFELRPRVSWNKGRAVEWLMEKLGLSSRADVAPIYLGDDLTDETAFAHLLDRGEGLPAPGGIGIIVRDSESLGRPTKASFSLRSTEEVRLFLDRLVTTFGSDLSSKLRPPHSEAI
jgi:trehalose-phosphatase